MKHFRRNFTLAALNGVFFNSASAFLSETTVLPMFISNLTSSRILVGLAGSLERASWPLPQVIVTPFADRSERKKPLYIQTAVIRFFSLLALSLMVFAFSAFSNSMLLVLFFLVFAIYSLSGGVAGPAFMDIVAKSIPADKRGSLWAVRISFGSGLAALGGFVVRHILRSAPFPTNYATIFLISTGLVTIGLLLFSFVVEPIQPTSTRRKSLGQHLVEGRRIFLQDNNYRGLVIFRLLMGVLLMATPFYVIFGRDLAAIEESEVGVLLAAQMIGLTLSNILWGSVANRLGSRLVLIGTALTGSIPPLGALVTQLFTPGLPYFALLFFFLGVSDAGLRLGYSTFLLDIAPPLKRLTYIGFINTAIAPVLFLPTLGGTIVDMLSYRVLFAAAAVAGGSAIYISTKLVEVRGKRERQVGSDR
jgi:MFS family permease